jgi:hypothetical protein
MVLSALAVIYISTPESAAATEAALSNTYNVLDSSESDSNATLLGNSLVNGLVIVSVICAMTCFIVVLYKYRCLSCLIGYMMISSGMLLGFLASVMFRVAIDRYLLRIDKLTFAVTMYNFAIVGVIAIFSGILGSTPAVVPVYVNQAYLVLTSVIVAWQLSHFDPWTAWVLLVLLALYDLLAVLTPCGPLRALVKLMQRDDAPAMPGLLYEASLTNTEPSSTNRSSQQNRVRRNNNDNNNHHHVGTNESDEPTNSDSSTAAAPVTSIQNETATTTMYAATDDDNVNPVLPTSDEATTYVSYDVDTGEGMSGVLPHGETGYIPLALAKLYKLPFRYDPQPPWITNAPPVSRNDTTAVSSSAAAPGESSLSSSSPSPSSPANIVTYTQQELQQLVEVVFPSTGGKIVPTLSLDSPVTALYRRTQNTDEARYTVIDHRGLVKRVLFVNHEGRIFQDLREENVELDRKERTSIKLGLGDFIFYSILVSKAALYSYTTFVICTLAVISGLGLTLLLLAVYGHALPALPISILLGVIFYLLTRYAIEPWVEDIFIARVYL